MVLANCGEAAVGRPLVVEAHERAVDAPFREHAGDGFEADEERERAVVLFGEVGRP